MEAWGNFFFAQVGASAALVGLIFVAVSINLTKILAYQGQPGRAFEAITVLTAILIMSSLLLIPDQSAPLIGVEVLVVSVGTWVLITRINIRNYTSIDVQYRAKERTNILFSQLALLPSVIGGFVLLFSGIGGLYLLVLGFMLSFIKALRDAWILLIEINR